MINNSKKHLTESKENYFEHMSVALRISFQMFICSIMAFIHAILPNLFTTNSILKIKELNSFIENRNKELIFN